MSVSFSVLTTMKNEGAFLLEWLAHHKALGFDAFVICTNDCEDPTTDMVLRLQRMGLVRHHATTYRPTQSIQRRAFRQAMQYEEIRKADWVYVCDADEFLCSRVGDGSVQALVAAGSPEVEAIAVPWRCFGTNGQQDFREGPITRQFTMANATEGPRAPAYAFPKSLFRGSVMPRLRRIGVHLPVALPDLAEPIRLELPGGPPAHARPVAAACACRLQAGAGEPLSAALARQLSGEIGAGQGEPHQLQDGIQLLGAQ